MTSDLTVVADISHDYSFVVNVFRRFCLHALLREILLVIMSTVCSISLMVYYDSINTATCFTEIPEHLFRLMAVSAVLFARSRGFTCGFQSREGFQLRPAL